MRAIPIRYDLHSFGTDSEMREGAAIRDWYTCDEFGALIDLAPYTVREHARLGRLHAEKRSSGRGAHCS